MGASLIFYVLGKPAPGGSKNAFVATRADGSVVRNRHGRPIVNVVDAGKGNDVWKARVKTDARAAMKAAGLTMMAGALRFEMVFYIQRPDGHFDRYGMVKLGAPRHPTSDPDTTKLIRSTEDALTGVVWKDDAQVVKQTGERVYATGWGVRISVSQME